MKYAPRRDVWLSAVIWSCVLLLVLAGLSPLAVEGAGLIGGTLICLFCLACAGFIAWLWIGIGYVLRQSELIVRTGPFAKTISLDGITKVRRIRSWMSSAATSSRRLELTYGRYDFIHLSPLQEEKFLAELKSRCPQARFE
ncbi:PH domain-containing protein [Paenibacillus ginsengarvi]|nr:PH domain-containing protein [Paenibacillus ginsengarvi]